MLIRPPRGLNAPGLATLLRTMYSLVSITELHRQADRQGGGPGMPMENMPSMSPMPGMPSMPNMPTPSR